jgi:F0F1-type ATP synthase delta subunit
LKKTEIRYLAKEIAKNLNKENENLEYLKIFSSIFEKRPVVLNLLSNPMIPYEKREEVFLKAMDMLNVPKASRAVIFSLFKNYSLGLLPQIIFEIEKELLKIKDVIPINIYIPLDFDENLKEKIIIFLQKKFGKKLLPNFEIKPEIIGGFEAISESYHLIASIKGHLKTLRFKEEKWV